MRLMSSVFQGVWLVPLSLTAGDNIFETIVDILQNMRFMGTK